MKVRHGGPAKAGHYVQLLRARAAVASVALLLAGGSVWVWASDASVLSVLDLSGSGSPPLIPTGASFSLAVAIPPTADRARILAASFAASGIPSFLRSLPDRQRYQVLVGPYVSIDEADRAQRDLAAAGVRRTRLVVDESLRVRSGRARLSRYVDISRVLSIVEAAGSPAVANPAVLVVPAAAGASVVLEMADEPSEIETRRINSTTLEVDAGPVTGPVATQQWRIPSDVSLVSDVSLEELMMPDAVPFVRATLTLAESVRSHVRVSGRRVYIDVFWPEAPPTPAVMPVERGFMPRLAGREGPPYVPHESGRKGPPHGSVGRNPIETSREHIRPALARFDDITPFLLSATAAPSADVLHALEQTLMSLDRSIRSVEAPSQSLAAHNLLLSAVAAALKAVDSQFPGDRALEARRAVGLVEAAGMQLQGEHAPSTAVPVIIEATR
jgi:hypothetical protein